MLIDLTTIIFLDLLKDQELFALRSTIQQMKMKYNDTVFTANATEGNTANELYLPSDFSRASNSMYIRENIESNFTRPPPVR